MTKQHWPWTALLPLALSACGVSIPEGKLKCAKDSDCPSDWMCADARCYSKAPSGRGDAGGQGGDGSVNANTGGQDGGGNNAPGLDGSLADSGIDPTGCDAQSTFYRDEDGDGFGDSKQSVMACSTDKSYVENADDCDDSCLLCTTSSASEVCDGADNNCNGRTDDGALEIGASVNLTAIPQAFWIDLVETKDGTIAFVLESDDDGARVVAQRLDDDGKPKGDKVTVVADVDAAVFAAAHENGKIVLAYPQQDAANGNEIRVKVTILKSSDLTEAVAPVTLGSTKTFGVSLDVAISTSTAGRVLVAYDESGVMKAQPRRLTDLASDGPAQTIYTQTGITTGAVVSRLVAGPCLSGFYAALLDLDNDKLVVQPLTDLGVQAGTAFVAADEPSAKLFTALPALYLEGGSCAAAPTRLVMAYARSTSLSTPAPSDITVSYLDITRTDAFADTLTLTAGPTIASTNWVIPAVVPFAAGFVIPYRPLSMTRHDGRYVLAAAVITGYDMANKATGNVIVHEVLGTEVLASHEGPSPPAPDVPLTTDLGHIGTRPWLATGRWSDNTSPLLFPLGYCD